MTKQVLIHNSGIVFEIDPNDKFQKISTGDIFNICGILIEWGIEVLKNDPEDPVVAMNDFYGYGVYESEKASVNENGSYSYPQDPDQNPLVKLLNPKTGKRMYFYDHAMLAIEKNDGGFFVTRMD